MAFIDTYKLETMIKQIEGFFSSQNFSALERNIVLSELGKRQMVQAQQVQTQDMLNNILPSWARKALNKKEDEDGDEQ